MRPMNLYMIIPIIALIMSSQGVSILPADAVKRAEFIDAQPKVLQEYVVDHFTDTPILADIARCESRFRHFDRDGNVIRGEVNRGDVGVMQINEFYHSDRAETLGFDLHTLEGNIAYAKYLYEKEGTRPWDSSSRCWKATGHIAKK